MAKRRKRRRRRRGIPPVFIALFLIVIVGAAGIITSYVKKYTPSDTRMDLEQYYKLEGQEEAALILQDTVSDSKGRVADGKIYIPLQRGNGYAGRKILLG